MTAANEGKGSYPSMCCFLGFVHEQWQWHFIWHWILDRIDEDTSCIIQPSVNAVTALHSSFLLHCSSMFRQRHIDLTYRCSPNADLSVETQTLKEMEPQGKIYCQYEFIIKLARLVT